MLTASPILVSADALDEARDFMRIDGNDLALSTLMAAAIGRCEDFIGERLLRRDFAETIAPTVAWRGLSAGPVTAIAGVDAIDDAGSAVTLAGAAYESDILADGRGRVRFLVSLDTVRARARYSAGRVDEWGDIDAQLRGGIIRLAAHWRVHREDDAALPDAVPAHWRAARRVRL